MKTWMAILGVLSFLGCASELTTIAYHKTGYGTKELITFRTRPEDFDACLTNRPVPSLRSPATNLTHFATAYHRGKVMRLFIGDINSPCVVAEVQGHRTKLSPGFACDLHGLQQHAVGKVERASNKKVEDIP